MRIRREKTYTPGSEVGISLDAAWKIHQAQSDWTSRVDTKAAYVFTIESAAIATAVTLSASGRAFSELQGITLFIFLAGILLLLIAAGLSSFVVIPRLRSKNLEKEALNNFIYFGHARFWNPESLKNELASTSILDQLSRQIVVMAEICWKKHLLVRYSFVCAIVGSLMLVCCVAVGAVSCR